MSKIMCSHPRCRKIINKQIEGLRCKEHKHNNKSGGEGRKILEHQRDPSGRYVYSTKQWKTLSKKKLSVNPFCEECWSMNLEVVADVVDHIVEIQDNNKLCYVWSNLKSLCHKCHNKKTKEQQSIRNEKKLNKRMGLFSI